MHLGVFGNPDSWYVNELCRVGSERGHLCSGLRFDEFKCQIGAGGLSWHSSGVCLNDLDAILVRTMPPGTLEQVVARMDMLGGLEASGTPVFNCPRAIECCVDKYLTSQRLYQQGLPVPPTVVCETAEQALDAFHQLNRDVLVKPLFGAEGRGIIRLSDEELAHRAFRTLERLGAVIYIQQFLNHSPEDLRILLLDGELVAAMKRTPRHGEFRANIAQQGSAKCCTPTDQELQLAKSAAAAVNCVFAGVDLMNDDSGESTIIEVNAVPGWRALERVCDVDVAGRLLKWLEETL